MGRYLDHQPGTEALNLNKSTVSRRVSVAIEMGYLINREDKAGLPARVVPGEALPGDSDVLSTLEELGRCCRFVA